MMLTVLLQHLRKHTIRPRKFCGVAKAFPGGWVAHPEDEIEEENEEKMEE